MRKKICCVLLVLGMFCSSFQAGAVWENPVENSPTDDTVSQLKMDASPETAELFSAEPVKLRIVPPDNTVVMQGTALDISGLTVYAVYQDETETPVTDYTLTGVNSSALGEQTVTVAYRNLTGSFPVTVEAKPEEDYITGFFLFSKPKREYTQGEPLDLSGMSLMVFHHLRPAEMVGPKECVVTGYNPNQIGVQTLTVSYGGKSSEFLVIVRPGADSPVQEDDVPKLMAPRMSVESVQGRKIVRFSRENNNDSTYGGQAVIYYTTDGTAPSFSQDGTPENGTSRYPDGGILVEETQTIKAMARLGKETSSVVSGRVSVPQVEAPTPANPHHRNNQGPNGGMTELEPGTLVSLLCNTSGASIFYWIDGQLGSAEESRYGGSIYIDSAYAVNGELTVCAYATKDGFRNSNVMRLRYRVPVQEPPAAETVNVALGSVHSRAGETVSTSLSITTEASSSVTGFAITVQYNRRAVEFLSVSSFAGATVSDAIPAGQLFSAPDTASGTVRIMCSGVNVSGGEMCMLNFRVFDSSEDQEIPLAVDAETADVSTSSGKTVEEEVYGGSIILLGSHNSQLSASVTFSGDNNNTVANTDELTESSRATASISVDEESAREYVESVRKENEDNPALTVTATAFVAFYGERGDMLSLETWEIDLSDLAYLLFERMMNMPDNAIEIKTMVLSDSLVPIMAVNEL